MTRPQQKRELLLSRTITFRLTEREYRRLEQIRKKSDCHAIGEVIRRQLSSKPIRIFHRDTSREYFLEELASIRQELKLIGVNINQVTRRLNAGCRSATERQWTEQVLAHYRQVDARVTLLLSLIAQLARSW